MTFFLLALAVGIGGALAWYAVMVAWYAVMVAPATLLLTRFDVPIAGLPASFDGYRIAVLTDFHHGPQQPVERARRAVAYANSQGPHLVVLLGDYGTSEGAMKGISRDLYQQMFAVLGPALRELRARDGILAVLGNHDFYADAQHTTSWLESLGVRVLRNASIEIGGGDGGNGGALRFVGIDDLVSGRVSADTIHALTHGDQPTVVLSHHPDVVRYCTQPSVRLVLAGHTHGGQVVFPFVGALVTRSTICTRLHPAGWVPNVFAPLFVSRGIGVQVPLRFRCAPEVVVLTLRCSPQQPV